MLIFKFYTIQEIMTKPSLFLYWVRLVYYPPYTTHLMFLEIPSVLWRNLTTTVWLIFTVTLLWIYAMWVYLYLGLDGSSSRQRCYFLTLMSLVLPMWDWFMDLRRNILRDSMGGTSHIKVWVCLVMSSLFAWMRIILFLIWCCNVKPRWGTSTLQRGKRRWKRVFK